MDKILECLSMEAGDLPLVKNHESRFEAGFNGKFTKDLGTEGVEGLDRSDQEVHCSPLPSFSFFSG